MIRRKAETGMERMRKYDREIEGESERRRRIRKKRGEGVKLKVPKRNSKKLVRLEQF